MLPLVTGMGTLFWMVRKSGYPTRCTELPPSPDTKTKVSSPGVVAVVVGEAVGVVASAVVDGPVVVIGLVVVTSLVVVGSAVVVG